MFNVKDLAAIKIGLASPEAIRGWSHGTVTKAETINYRSHKPERDGLYCEKIFGPSKDYECNCGKYKKIRYQGKVCEKCGVEVISKQVRRERMGSIELNTPCTHIWYLCCERQTIRSLLNCINPNLKQKELEDVVYFAAHIVLNVGRCSPEALQLGEYLDDKTAPEVFKRVLKEIMEAYPNGSSEYDQANYLLDELNNRLPNEPFAYFDYKKFISKTFDVQFGEGADAIKKLLHNFDLRKELANIQKKLKENDDKKSNNANKMKLLRQQEIINDFISSGNKPEWMVLDVIPVIPPDLRPMLQLDGGRFAASDINELYRRVITRNNRLKKLIDSNAPEVILMNEKRMVQEAVDALIDNGRRGKAIINTAGRPFKCLTESLKGKQGRFRQNLLGKRVDYSGRSVIAVGPDLRIYQCGLPREMAIQLFRPFIAAELIKARKVNLNKEADRLIDRKDPIVFDVVEKIISDHPVLLNRAPTLHRLGIQAFQPKLVDGRAIRLHPLVCAGFNADFDGDQMAVHVPLSRAAQEEALNLMLASNNILSPKDGKPIVTPSQDMVLGNYYLTVEETKEDFLKRAEQAHADKDYDLEEKYKLYAESEGKVFSSVNDVLKAYETKQISLHNRIAIVAKALMKKDNVFTDEMQSMYLLTSVGRIVFNLIFPGDFPYLNDAKDQSLKFNIDNPDKKKYIMRDFAPKGTNIRELIAKLPVRDPFKKKDLQKIIDQVFHRYETMTTSVILDKIKDQGFKYSTFSGVTISLSDIRVLENKESIIKKGDEKVEAIESMFDKGLLTPEERHNHIIDTWNGVRDEIVDKLNVQLKGDINNPLYIIMNSGARGNISNFAQLEGMRGLMNKPNGEKIEIPIKSCFREGMTVSEFFTATHGARKGGADTALKTANSGYLTRRLVDVSQGVIVREEDCGSDHGFVMRAIMSPGQNKPMVSLYNRIRGRYAMRDIINPVTKEVIVKGNTLISNTKAHEIENCGIKEVEIRSLLTCKTKDGVCVHCYGRNLATGKEVSVGEAVGIMAAQSIGEPGTQLTMRTFHSGGVSDSDITQGLPRVEELVEARNPKGKATITTFTGKIVNIDQGKLDKDITFTIASENESDEKTVEISAPFNSHVVVKVGDHVKSGDRLTAGPIRPIELLFATDVTTLENYMLEEIHKPYCLQEIEINDKHLEIIISRMLSKIKIIDLGDTHLLDYAFVDTSMKSGVSSIYVDTNVFIEENKKVLLNGGRPAVAIPWIFGITKASLKTESFLSAASYQQTLSVLDVAAVKGKTDHLVGLKENVITGKLIPAGRGLLSDEGKKEIVEQFTVAGKFNEVEGRYVGVYDSPTGVKK